jgi:glycosyltransferase involved in cell wall biosynthesis
LDLAQLDVPGRIRRWKDSVDSALATLHAATAQLQEIAAAQALALEKLGQEAGASKAALAEAERRIEELQRALQQTAQALADLAARHERAAAAEDSRLAALEARLAAAEAVVPELGALRVKYAALRVEGAGVFRALARASGEEGAALAAAAGVHIVERGGEALIAASVEKDGALGSGDIAGIARKIASGEITGASLVSDSAGAATRPAPALLRLIADMPAQAAAFFEASARPRESAPSTEHQARTFAALKANPDLVDFAAAGGPPPAPPFDAPHLLPPFAAPAPKTRSAVFMNSAYYNFGYLAAALRKRGWDAVSASIADPDGYPKLYTHGHDVTLYDRDLAGTKAKTAKFLKEAFDRFGVVHYYGVSTLTFFYDNWDNTAAHDRVPWDTLEWKRRGALVGYSVSGCLDMASQRSFSAWSGGMCDICPWQDEPSICSDEKNLAWGRKVAEVADILCIETDVMLDYRAHEKVFREPLTFALDPEVWRPDLPIPEAFRVERESAGEVLVYHSVGNYKERLRGGRNVKGTPAVVAAVEKLREEGMNIRLIFKDNVPNLENRYYQAQADIIVDQLNYGRYGATAREGFMLGRPVVGALNRSEPEGTPSLCIEECPIAPATEDTIAEVLRDLAGDAKKRAALGAAGRAYALKWWSADVLAARFERVYDFIREHGRTPRFSEVG